MAILIDGYNFMAVSGVFAERGAPTLARSRAALLDFLATRLSADEVKTTTIVFDAANAPPGLPRSIEHRGLHVRFAAPGQDADSLIEELIRLDSAPRRLTVVSSDHRLQRAAKRRKARAVDSEVFREELAQRKRAENSDATQFEPEKPSPAADSSDTLAWLAEFGASEPPPPPPKDASPFPPGFGYEPLPKPVKFPPKGRRRKPP